MRLSFRKWILAACSAAVLTHGTAYAEGRLWQQHRPFSWTDPNCPTAIAPPGTVAPEPKTAPVDPNAPANPMAVPNAPVAEANPSFSPMQSAALGDTSFAVAAPGYIDFAKPMNVLRLRYDAAYDMNRPDRAEYFYGKCGCFGGNAPGPVLPERSVDAQEASVYLEVAPTERFSVFIDLPFRMINPEVNDNASGIGDVRYGFKYAFVYTDNHIVSLQVRGYAPTGDARRGLGTSHNSIEPTILYTGRFGDNWTVYGQFGEWVPIDGTDFAGNILLYGAGVGYTAYDTGNFKVTPLVEFVGWSVLSGKEFNPDTLSAVNAAGDNIVNGKIGVRAGGARQDVYVGYGRALTGDVWYKDIWRLEYRFKF